MATKKKTNMKDVGGKQKAIVTKHSTLSKSRRDINALTNTIHAIATKESLITDIKRRQEDKIIEESNAKLLIKLINNADDLNEAINIAALGTTYKRTGFHFDKRLEKLGDTIKYFKKNEKLSFVDIKANKKGTKSNKKDEKITSSITHKLIIGDNYDALQNLLIEYKGKIDVIYIDPPYGKDSMGEFAETNYDNAITRDNLLSMLYNRLILARELMSDEGVIFCSIDDRNQAYVKGLFDEIFGETKFLFNVPRLTKKGGKSTDTIAKNNDYIIAYTNNVNIVFSQEEKDISKYNLVDEFEDIRGKYCLTQTLDYNSLQYSKNMDYEIELEGKKFVPGGNVNLQKKRLAGQHGVTDWVWRWGKSAVEWGIKEKLLVIKGNRIYTKSYTNCSKANGKNELIFSDPTKAYTTLSFIDNRYSNDNAKKELDKIFIDGSTLFKNPKPSSLISSLIKMVNLSKDAIILDFFAGSGTTGQAVLELNKEDGGNRQFILCQMNEKTDTTPKGIAYDVTCKRLKRVMTGKCYDNKSNFEWIKKNEPLGGSLDVYEIAEVFDKEKTKGKTAFDVIDETLYGVEKFKNINDKIRWVCENFEHTTKYLED